MTNGQAIVGIGLLGAVLGVIPGTNAVAQAQHDLIREGDLREADYANPGSWDHVDELANDLEKYAQTLHHKVHRHLEGHRYFRHMDGHATEIEELARHIHGLAHRGQSIRHLREDVIELDSQVHHADDVITKIARHGVAARHYDGAVRQTRRIVDSMTAILHHLEDDLTKLDPSYRRGRRYEVRRPRFDRGSRTRRPSDWYHDHYPGRGFDRHRGRRHDPHGWHHHHGHHHGH